MTPKQKRFCEEYVIHLNGAKAASDVGYSKRTARKQASRLLTKADLKQYIKDLLDKKAIRSEITADRILEEIRRIAFFSLSSLYHDDGRLKEPHELTVEDGAVISSFKSRKDVVDSKSEIYEYKTYDKQKSLELLCRHLGLLSQENGVEVTVNIEDKDKRLKALKKEILGK